MMLLIVIGVGVLVIWWYILFGREWLVKKFPGGRVQYWHENIEDKLWDSSRTMLVARGYQLAGWLIGLQALATAAGIDTMPFITSAAEFIPEKYRSLALSGFFIITGLAFAKLRKMTSKPLEGGVVGTDIKGTV